MKRKRPRVVLCGDGWTIPVIVPSITSSPLAFHLLSGLFVLLSTSVRRRAVPRSAAAGGCCCHQQRLCRRKCCQLAVQPAGQATKLRCSRHADACERQRRRKNARRGGCWWVLGCCVGAWWALVERAHLRPVSAAAICTHEVERRHSRECRLLHHCLCECGTPPVSYLVSETREDKGATAVSSRCLCDKLTSSLGPDMSKARGVRSFLVVWAAFASPALARSRWRNDIVTLRHGHTPFDPIAAAGPCERLRRAFFARSATGAQDRV